jgi:hypothetical protein
VSTSASRRFKACGRLYESKDDLSGKLTKPAGNMIDRIGGTGFNGGKREQ